MRRAAAGAVAHRAAQRRPRGNPLRAMRVEDEVRVAAGGGGRVAKTPVDERGADRRLVVAAEDRPRADLLDDVHAVVQRRRCGTAREAREDRVAGPAERPVAEARRQADQRQARRLVDGRHGVAVRIAFVPVLPALRLRLAGVEQLERADDGRAADDGRRAAQERAPIDRAVDDERHLLDGRGCASRGTSSCAIAAARPSAEFRSCEARLHSLSPWRSHDPG